MAMIDGNTLNRLKSMMTVKKKKTTTTNYM